MRSPGVSSMVVIHSSPRGVCVHIVSVNKRLERDMSPPVLAIFFKIRVQ